MKLKLALALVAFLSLTGGIAIFATRGEETDPPTAIVPTPTATAMASPTSTPQSVKQLGVVWTPLAPADTVGDGTMFLIDSQTGQIYSATDDLGENGPRLWMTWEPQGFLSLWMYPRQNTDGSQGGFYVGEPLGGMTLVQGEVPAVSSRGVAAAAEDGKISIIELASGRELFRLSTSQPQRPGGWSWDGRYLALITDGDDRNNTKSRVSVWDFDTRQMVTELTATGLIWANRHNRFLYAADSDGDGRSEDRIRDLASGTDVEMESGGFYLPSTWSPNDDFVVGSLQVERGFWFSILDAATGKKLTTIGGAWPMRWLDDDTVGVLGDVCTGATNLYYMDADGASLEKVVAFGDNRVVHPSPQGDRYAYTERLGEDIQFKLVIVDRSTGATVAFETGTSFLFGHPWNQAWSQDGRYLILMSSVGKDGACMGVEPEPFQLIRHP